MENNEIRKKKKEKKKKVKIRTFKSSTVNVSCWSIPSSPSSSSISLSSLTSHSCWVKKN